MGNRCEKLTTNQENWTKIDLNHEKKIVEKHMKFCKNLIEQRKSA